MTLKNLPDNSIVSLETNQDKASSVNGSYAHSSVIDAEVEQFSKLAEKWWDLSGEFAPLHRFNPTRVRFIRDTALVHFIRPTDELRPFTGLRLLDVGCGGGLLSEPMARMGFEVTGLDASERNIAMANLHANQGGLKIDYRATTIEDFEADEANRFDVVLCMEVIEHVNAPEAFLKSVARCVKPGGILIVATLNKTLKSHALAIVGAEYVLGWVPRGTHDWNKFIRPETLKGFLQNTTVKHIKSQGVSYNPMLDQWSLGDDLSVNYMMLFSSCN